MLPCTGEPVKARNVKAVSSPISEGMVPCTLEPLNERLVSLLLVQPTPVQSQSTNSVVGTELGTAVGTAVGEALGDALGVV